MIFLHLATSSALFFLLKKVIKNFLISSDSTHGAGKLIISSSTFFFFNIHSFKIRLDMIPSRNSTVSFLMSSFLSNNGNWLRGKWRFRFPQWKCMVTGNRKLQMHVKKVQYLVTCLCLFCFLVHLFLLCFCFSYASRDKCLCLPVLYTYWFSILC